jgi:hypothetical protein
VSPEIAPRPDRDGPCLSSEGIIVCKKQHRFGEGTWETVTQAMLTEWVRNLGGEIRCDNCGKALDRNSKRRDERRNM